MAATVANGLIKTSMKRRVHGLLICPDRITRDRQDYFVPPDIDPFLQYENCCSLKALTDHLVGGSRVGSFDPY